MTEISTVCARYLLDVYTYRVPELYQIGNNDIQSYGTATVFTFYRTNFLATSSQTRQNKQVFQLRFPSDFERSGTSAAFPSKPANADADVPGLRLRLRIFSLPIGRARTQNAGTFCVQVSFERSRGTLKCRVRNVLWLGHS